MCSIFGAIGKTCHLDGMLRDVRIINDRCRDRGRDGSRVEVYMLENGLAAIFGCCRATPTPEIEDVVLQPYDALLHNGTIANDVSLGRLPGEVDSMVLPRVLDRRTVEDFVASLSKVQGSYAIACLAGQRWPRRADRVLLAANYKPLHYVRCGHAVYFASMERHLSPVVPPFVRPCTVEPYSVLSISSLDEAPESIALRPPLLSPRRVVVVASAGLDSTVAATQYVRDGDDVCLLHFRYGCTATSREADRVQAIAQRLGCKVQIMELPAAFGSGRLLGDERLAGGVEGAEYAHEWVPARNLVMLATACAYAEANGYNVVALGNNLEEAGAYPDNEEQFTHLLDGLMPYVTQNGYTLRIESPVGRLMKREIVALGLSIGAPFELTWSCYRGGESHCGECGPCFMRRTAFARNGVEDPVFS